MAPDTDLDEALQLMQEHRYEEALSRARIAERGFDLAMHGGGWFASLGLICKLLCALGRHGEAEQEALRAVESVESGAGPLPRNMAFRLLGEVLFETGRYMEAD